LPFKCNLQRYTVGLHLESLAPDNIVCGIISSQWLLTLFVNVLPTEAGRWTSSIKLTHNP
jgi:hypothetical protein